jgi:hypothetical protein
MSHNHGLDRTSTAEDWLYEPHRDDLDDMTLYCAAMDLKRLARDKRFVSFSDRELLEEIQKYASIIMERGTQ